MHAEDGEFRSWEEAKRYFDWKVARSAKILTQGIKINFKGKPVEYRAEVVLEPDQKQSAVMWTEWGNLSPNYFQVSRGCYGTREAIRLLSKRCVGISRRPYKTGLHRAPHFVLDKA